MRRAADGDCVPGGDGDGGHDDRRPRPRPAPPPRPRPSHGRNQHPAADQEKVRFRAGNEPSRSLKFHNHRAFSLFTFKTLC